ncbi:EAL domain-containing protein [Vagococcus sp. WN89Y]|uniref:EAL domain-containing protein n=1 Tax=Vagococcus sp. WN89Y TaxID=3457258 RepID=UPI003FCC3C95
MSVEFRPVIQFSGKKIFRYEAMAKFFNAEGIQTPTQQTLYELAQRGLINDAIAFLFDTVCDLLIRKASLAIDLNLSQLLVNSFDQLDMLYKKCQQSGVQQCRIELSGQFNQDQLISNLPFLKQAKHYGFMTALDDAGNGHFPDESLQLFRFDTIKLAHASLECMAMDTVKFYRLQKVIKRFIASGASVICAGVKKSSDLPLLNKYHHIGMQGYLFHRTLSFSQLQLLEDV